MSNINQSLFLPNEINISKKTSKHCSLSYRKRLKRIKTNCQLIRERRRRCLFPILPIEIRPSLFQQRYYQKGSLELLNINNNHWQSTNFLRLSDEYLYKCKYAIYSSTNKYFKQNEFYYFLKQLFSYNFQENKHKNLNLCQLCNYKFNSFDLHINRRSVLIQYQCLICQSWIKTMNPCQAYYHLLSHKNISKEICIEQLNINYDWKNSLTFIDDIFANYSSNY